jgi:hypothetical protein
MLAIGLMITLVIWTVRLTSAKPFRLYQGKRTCSHLALYIGSSIIPQCSQKKV